MATITVKDASGTNAARYVVGCMWQTLSGRSLVKSAKVSFKGFPGDAWVLLQRSTGAMQAGLVESPSGDEIGLPSLATAIASKLSNNTLLRFRLPEGQWVFAFFSGTIHSAGDQFFPRGDEKRAETQFNNLKSLGLHWDEVADLDSEQSSVERLGVLLAGSSPVLVTKRQTGAGLPAKVAIGVAVVVVLGGVAVVVKHLTAKAPAPVKVVRHPMVHPAVVQQVHPWEQEPSPQSVVASCMDILSTHPSAADGWEATSVSCGPHGASITYERTLAGSHLLLPAGAVLMPNNEDTAVVTVPLSLSVRGAGLTLTDYGTATGTLLDLALSIGASPNITPARAHIGPSHPQGMGPVVPQSAQWDMTLNGTSPAVMETSLGQIPGLVISSIEWDIERAQWKLNGDIYYAS